MYPILEMFAINYVYLCYLTFTASRPTSELSHVYQACSIAVITSEAHYKTFVVFSFHSPLKYPDISLSTILESPR